LVCWRNEAAEEFLYRGGCASTPALKWVEPHWRRTRSTVPRFH